MTRRAQLHRTSVAGTNTSTTLLGRCCGNKKILTITSLLALTTAFDHQPLLYFSSSSHSSTGSTSTTIPLANAFSATNTMSSKRILCFGDSLTAGTSSEPFLTFPYAPHLEAKLNEISKQPSSEGVTTKGKNDEFVVTHAGFPGWTAAQLVSEHNGEMGLSSIIRRIQDQAEKEENDSSSSSDPLSLVILMAGTNDLGYRRSAEEIVKSIIELHELCYRQGVPNTLAIGVPPSGYQSMSPDAAKCIQTVNGQLKLYCEKEESKATYVDFPFGYEKPPETKNPTTLENYLWAFDGLHFSPKGYEVLGESLAPTVYQIVTSSSSS